MNNPTCSTCRYWHPIPSVGDIGECRLKPPVVVIRGPVTPETHFPKTHQEKWCGEHPAIKPPVVSTHQPPANAPSWMIGEGP